MNRDERYHPTLLILNEILRISDAEIECIRIKSLGREPEQNIRTIIDSQPVDWLTEQTFFRTADSETARNLVFENFKKVRYPFC